MHFCCRLYAVVCYCIWNLLYCVNVLNDVTFVVLICFKFTPSVQGLSYIILINAAYASETSQNNSLYILY